MIGEGANIGAGAKIGADATRYGCFYRGAKIGTVVNIGEGAEVSPGSRVPRRHHVGLQHDLVSPSIGNGIGVIA